MTNFLRLEKTLFTTLLVTLALLMLSITTAAADGSVYLSPSSISAAPGNTVNVELWVDASNFQGGQVELAYDPACVKVDNFTINRAVFSTGAWSQANGKDRITFTADNMISGKYQIGTLKLKCVATENCITDLIINNPYSGLFNAVGSTVPVSFSNGKFSCICSGGPVTPTPAPSGSVYLSPSSISAAPGNTVNVQLWADASNFQGGQVELAYDPACVKVDNFTINPAIFTKGGWSQANGKDRITFTADNMISGKYQIGTLKLKCVATENCTTALTINNPYSGLFNAVGSTVPVSFSNGKFSCICSGGPVTPPASAEVVYVSPSCVATAPGTTAYAQLWVDASRFQGGQIELTYDPACVKVDNFTINPAVFTKGAWSQANGKDHITFAADNMISGKYQIGTLKLKCVATKEGMTPLIINNSYSGLYNDKGFAVPVSFSNGKFICGTACKDGIYLKEGWNFISIPYALENPSFSNLLSGSGVTCKSLLYYDASHCTWVSAKDLEPLKGYWVYVDGDVVIPESRLIQKAVESPSVITLYPGWNAVGSSSKCIVHADVTFLTVDKCWIKVVGPWSGKNYVFSGYNGKSGMLGENVYGADAFDVETYEGYWIYVDKQCKLA